MYNGMSNDNPLSIVKRIKENDSEFDEKSFLELVKNNILSISQNILMCNYIELLNLESKLLYENDFLLIENSLANDCITYCVIEDVNSISIIDYKKEKDCEYVYCKLSVNLRNVTAIPSKREIIKFDAIPTNTFKFVEVIRTSDVSNNEISTVCPMCGAELEINNIGRCIYCNSLIENKSSSWLINRIDKYYFFGKNEK